MKTPLTAATELILEHEQKTPGLSRQQAIQCAISTASRLVQNSQGIPVLFNYWAKVEEILYKLKAEGGYLGTKQEQELVEEYTMKSEESKRQAIVNFTSDINDQLIHAASATAFMHKIGLLPEDKKDVKLTVLDGYQKTFNLSNLLREYCIQIVADTFNAIVKEK